MCAPVRMRRKDSEYWAVLTIQSWRRGRPLVPATAEDAEEEQSNAWSRINPLLWK